MYKRLNTANGQRTIRAVAIVQLAGGTPTTTMIMSPMSPTTGQAMMILTIARTAAQKWTEVITMSNDIKTGDFVKCVEMPYYGVSGVVIKQYCLTACEEQTMIRCIDSREFHAPTRCFVKVG